jgi:hypothetical protein
VEQDVNDASQQAAKVLPPEVKHEIMGQHHPITIEAHLDVSDVLNEVEKLRDVSTPAMMIEAYRVFEVFLRHTLRQRAPEDSGWPSASLPDYAVKHGLLNAGQAEVLHRLREIRDDCSRLERGAHVNQGVSHRYVTALREMTCTIDKRMKDATRRG